MEFLNFAPILTYVRSSRNKLASDLLRLPGEICNRIYDSIFPVSTYKICKALQGDSLVFRLAPSPPWPGLLYTFHQLNQEAAALA